MPNNPDKINELLDQLELLSKKQALFQKEINELQAELYALKYSRKPETPPLFTETPIEEEKPIQIHEVIETPKPLIQEPIRQQVPQRPVAPPKPQVPKQKSDLEKFIGENLINKIGILILIIGVGIGAKYAIDNELISPLTRIILGYAVGLGLMGFAIWLKKNYLNFSAVLLSGAMAIMYFITFAAYSFYGLMPQSLTFGLMVLFTAFTVVAALNYEKQVIAHIGLVGAYAVPFLLSDGSGKVFVLFTYMAIINAGILAVAIKKYWKALYYVSFGLTWAIFLTWYFAEYKIDIHFNLALSFLSIFFVIFYGVFLGYKLVQKENFSFSDVAMLLLNSSIFYGLGYALLNEHKHGMELLGLFTLGNAIVHFAVGGLIYQLKLGDRNLFYMVMGLVMAFITIAIPVQLEGHWVVLLWSVEAALIFWIGRTKDVPFYEKLSYLMMALAFYCLAYDWQIHYLWETFAYSDISKTLTPIFNPQFLGSMVFIASFAFINYLNQTKPPITLPAKWASPIIHYGIPAILLITIYFAFYLEITQYFAQAYQASVVNINTPEIGMSSYWNEDIRQFGNLWLMNYSMIFAVILAIVNIYGFKNRSLGIVNLILLSLFIGVFLLNGLGILSALRFSYLDHQTEMYFKHGIMNIAIRYICYLFVGISLATIYKYLKEAFVQPLDTKLPVVYDIFLYGTILWISSTELITWVEMSGSADSFKLGLSIFWGIYSLLLIVLGIAQKKKHLRIGAIILFGITLFKLIFYDLSSASTIARTVIFISLGVLLLIISFLYNKFKHLIFDDEEETK